MVGLEPRESCTSLQVREVAVDPGFHRVTQGPQILQAVWLLPLHCPATTTKGTGCFLVCFLSPGVQSPHPLSHLKPPEPASPSARVCVMAPS